VGLNNKRVWPKADKTRQMSMGLYQQLDLASPTPTDKIMELCKNVKTHMTEQKFSNLTRDPENLTGHQFLRDKYMLPQPNSFYYGRSQGGINNIELEKLGIGTVRGNKVF